jgi:hypothetical protein
MQEKILTRSSFERISNCCSGSFGMATPTPGGRSCCAIAQRTKASISFMRPWKPVVLRLVESRNTPQIGVSSNQRENASRLPELRTPMILGFCAAVSQRSRS